MLLSSATLVALQMPTDTSEQNNTFLITGLLGGPVRNLWSKCAYFCDC